MAEKSTSLTNGERTNPAPSMESKVGGFRLIWKAAIMLSHLIYVSKRDENCSDDDIQQILKAGLRNNKPKEITGVLLFSKTHFIQYLEGPFQKLFDLYQQIKVDPRHHQAMVISFSHIDKRLFPSWHMGKKEISGQIEFISQLSTAEKNQFQRLLKGDKLDRPSATHLIEKFFK